MVLRDLSQKLQEGMPVYPGDPAFQARPLLSVEKDGMNVLSLSFGTHVGTHVDVPRHFLSDGAAVDALPLDRFCGPARLLRLPHRPGEPIRIPDGALDDVRRDEILVVRTGWEREAGTSRFYTDCPVYAADVPERLVASGIKALGVDLPTVVSEGEPRAMHVALLSAGIVLVEGLVGLDALQRATFRFYALPLRLAAADGSPVRAFAVEEGED